MCHHIAFICTARVVIHRQHRSYHGSGGYLLASNRGSQDSIPGQFILIFDGGIGQIFLPSILVFPICIILPVLHGLILSPVDTV